MGICGSDMGQEICDERLAAGDFQGLDGTKIDTAGTWPASSLFGTLHLMTPKTVP